MSSSLATSGTVEPEERLPSACRSFRTICSGECLFAIESPSFAHRGLLDAHPNWTRPGVGSDLPAPLVAPELASVLSLGFLPVPTVRRNHLYAPLSEGRVQWVGVVGPGPDQTL